VQRSPMAQQIINKRRIPIDPEEAMRQHESLRDFRSIHSGSEVASRLSQPEGTPRERRRARSSAKSEKGDAFFQLPFLAST